MVRQNTQSDRERTLRGPESDGPGRPDFRPSRVDLPASNGVGERTGSHPKLSDMMQSYRGWWNLPRSKSRREAAPVRDTAP
jgi:hypothetical protein